jgi:hypothetical protein
VKPEDISRERGKCLTRKINEPETNSKNRNIRDLWSNSDEFKAGYQPRREGRSACKVPQYEWAEVSLVNC